MTLKNYIKWLENNFPEDAILVKTKSRAWFADEVEKITSEELYDMFYLKKKPEIKGKPVEKPCLVIFDKDSCDY